MEVEFAMEIESTGSLSAGTKAASADVNLLRKELDTQENIANKLLEPVEELPRSSAHPTGQHVNIKA